MTRGMKALALLPLLFIATPALAQGDVVNVYSYREPGLIQPLLDRFTAETGNQDQCAVRRRWADRARPGRG